MSNASKVWITVATSVLAVALVAAGVWFWFYMTPDDTCTVPVEVLIDREALDGPQINGNSVSQTESGIRTIEKLDDFGLEKWSEGTVCHDGRYYRYNDDLQNYLLLGIDNDNIVRRAEDGISGGQSDGMFLLSVDTNKRRIAIVAINRNTMVPVDVYDRDGNFLMRMDLQICLQHGYGDGMKLSCMRSVEAVDRLFRGIPVSGYVSMNVGGISAVNDAAGGVSLTPIETVSLGDVIVKEGETVNLSGEQAYVYLRARDVDSFGSADRRLERQQQYIKAFVAKVLANPDLGSRIFEAGKDYMVASIDLPRLIESSKDVTFDENDLYTPEGETYVADGYECFKADEGSMIKLILDVFYEEVDGQ